MSRNPGSLGPGTDPSRVIKGKKLPGRMGGHRVTVRNLEIVKVDADRNLLFVKGALPGTRNSYLFIAR
jgi:large subunit ribosomal protein L3